MSDSRSAILYRMVLPDHVCPYGLRAKALLESAGFAIDDRQLTSREQVDSLMDELGVDTTPQVLIGDERIGGCDELEAFMLDA
jgi:glutaredoxin 3